MDNLDKVVIEVVPRVLRATLLVPSFEVVGCAPGSVAFDESRFGLVVTDLEGKCRLVALHNGEFLQRAKYVHSYSSARREFLIYGAACVAPDVES